MLERILRFSIRQRWVVLAVTLGIAALGIYNYQNLPIDAVPDITNVQVQINTEAGGFTPFEVESMAWHPRLAATTPIFRVYALPCSSPA